MVTVAKVGAGRVSVNFRTADGVSLLLLRSYGCTFQYSVFDSSGKFDPTNVVV